MVTGAFEEERAVRYTEWLYRGDPRNCQVAENHIHAMTTVPTSLEDRLQTLQLPATVIHGTADRLVPLDHGETTAHLLPGADLIRLQSAGHMFLNTQTLSEIAAALDTHLRRGDPAPD